MMAGVANRQGMIFVDDHDDEEDSAPPVMTGSYHEHGSGGGLQRPGSPVSSSGVESEGSYAEVYSDDSYHSDGDEIAEIWDPYLYQLQMQAPKAKCVPCLRRLPDRPYYYGEEYHGSITRDETAHLLGNEDGNYLVRQGLSQSGSYSLSFVFGGTVRHYRLYFEGNDHYVGEKPFETIEDLVQDGLITLHMEANNVEEYLRSARETRLTHSTNLGGPPPDPPNLDPIQETPPTEHPVFFGSEELSSRSSSDCMPRKPPYYPCTIPQRHSSVNSPPLPELSKEESKRILMKGYVPPHHHHHHPSSPTSPLSSHHPHSSQHTHNGTVDIVTPGSPIKSRKESSIYYYEKPHNFKLHSYIGMMAWCDSCRNFMWGLRNQGYKCKDCGYNAHKQCKDETAPNCQPTKQLVKRVYGVELTTLVKMQCTKVPVVVKSCIEEIERRGMDAEGIYRISGKTNDILRIKKEFDNNMDANLKSVDDIHALTGAMKLYLRELPVPLMTFDAYDICLIAARSGSIGESLDMLRVALERLPPAHYNTLRHLMRHLHKVQQQKLTNKMDSKNLALVFTPSLMRSPYNNSGMMAMQKLPEQKKAVDLLIQHFHSLFN